MVKLLSILLEEHEKLLKGIKIINFKPNPDKREKKKYSTHNKKCLWDMN